MADFIITTKMRLVSLLFARDDSDERGASLVEYALLLALIAIVCFAALQFLGGQTNTMYSDMGNSLSG
jgi:pilus assembly protein Flp/PilA